MGAAGGASEVTGTAAHGPAVAERVGFIEEDDHPAVAHGELAQLSKQALDLHDADAHEHGLERAGVDEDKRLPSLAGDGFGHERLTRTGRAPQQDAARDVAAPLLDGFRVLEKDHVL